MNIKPNLTISKNFKLQEFLVSSDYPNIARALRLNTRKTENIIYGTALFLQPLRNLYPDNKLIIFSGYRSKKLNDSVHGSSTSDHLDACAVDFAIAGIEIMEIYYRILHDFPFYRELFAYPRNGFLHLSWNRPGKRVKCVQYIRVSTGFNSRQNSAFVNF